MKKGNIIFLNGVTSSGKTTLSKSIQELAEENYYHMSCDVFQQMISQKFLNKDYWGYLSEGIVSMYKTAKMMSSEGINVIIDGTLLDMPEFVQKYHKSNYEMMKSILFDSRLLVVEVYCPLDECKRRNIVRGDRYESQSEEQNKIMEKNIEYHFSVNTQEKNALDCAKDILAKLSHAF
jgi:chloramphenicol 3-O phosphotransferase